MRKVGVFTLMMALILTACTAIEGDTQVNEPELFVGGTAYEYNIVTDVETGCQYVEGVIDPPGTGSGKGLTITPRLDSDGKPMCGIGN